MRTLTAALLAITLASAQAHAAPIGEGALVGATVESFESQVPGTNMVQPVVGLGILNPGQFGPFTFASGLIFDEPSPNNMLNQNGIAEVNILDFRPEWFLPGMDLGDNGFVDSSADVPLGSAFIASLGFDVLTLGFTLPAVSSRVGAKVTCAAQGVPESVELRVFDCQGVLLETSFVVCSHVDDWPSNFIGIEREEGICGVQFVGAGIALDDVAFQENTCGDGFPLAGEACDDGNTNDDDGCTSTCAVEAGWSCNSAAPSVCADQCAVAEKAVFLGKSMDDPGKSKLTIKLIRAGIPETMSGTPDIDTDYTLSLRGSISGFYERTLLNDTASGASRWSPAGTGYNYRNASKPTDNGIQKVVVREEGAPGKANGKLLWKGRGPVIGEPPMSSLQGDLELRATNSHGMCVKATIPALELTFKTLKKGELLKGKTP